MEAEAEAASCKKLESAAPHAEAIKNSPLPHHWSQRYIAKLTWCVINQLRCDNFCEEDIQIFIPFMIIKKCDTELVRLSLMSVGLSLDVAQYNFPIMLIAWLAKVS